MNKVKGFIKRLTSFRAIAAGLVAGVALGAVIFALTLLPVGADGNGEAAGGGGRTDPGPLLGARVPNYTDTGAETCMQCHSTQLFDGVAATAHGDASNPHTPFANHECESCHGRASVHASRAGGGRGFPSLVTFAEEDAQPRQLEACLACHAQAMGDFPAIGWAGTTHEAIGLGCVDCHQVHASPAEHLSQLEICGGCHRRQVTAHLESGLLKGDGAKPACAMCHYPHEAPPPPE